MWKVGASLAICVSGVDPWRMPGQDACVIGGVDFSSVGAVEFPATVKDGGVAPGWQVSICHPMKSVCHDLKAGNVQRGACQGNDTDSFNVSSVLLTSHGVTLNFTSQTGDVIVADVGCDPQMKPGFVIPWQHPTTEGDVTTMALRSKCACPGGCGNNPIPRANPNCGSGSIDISSVIPTTFRATKGENSWESGLWYFSPCGATKALCPEYDAAFLAGKVGRRSSRHHDTCDSGRNYNQLGSISRLRGDVDGLAMTFVEEWGEATAYIRCDLDSPKLSLEAAGKPREVWKSGQSRFFNYTSRCACPGECPKKRDYWFRGPGQVTGLPGSQLDYPEDYPGRVMRSNGAFVGEFILLLECQGACDSLGKNCSGFSYSVPNNRTCMLHGSPSCGTLTSPSWNWTTYYLSNGDCPEQEISPTVGSIPFLPMAADAYCTEESQKCLGGTVVGRVEGIAEHSTCCQLCSLTPGCSGFSVHFDESACELYTGKLESQSGNCTSGKPGTPPSTTTTTTTTTTSTTTTTFDYCTVAGMHFQNIQTATITLPLLEGENVSHQEWQVSFCSPLPATCATEKDAFIRMKDHFKVGEEGCVDADLEFHQQLNFSAGASGADFLFAQPGVGIARVAVTCDYDAPETPEPFHNGVAVLNGSAPDAFYTIRFRSKCACPGVCGPLAELEPVHCQIDDKNFTAPAPLRFVAPVNLTDGWENGIPVNAPPGLRGDEMHEWSISLCKPAVDLCDEPSFVQGRPQNASWCNAGEAFSKLHRRSYYASTNDAAVFVFEGQHTSAKVHVGCSGNWGRCEGEGGLSRDGYYMVTATGAGTNHIHYEFHVKSRCACNLPGDGAVRYHCVKETQQCVMDTKGHHTMDKCVADCVNTFLV